MSGRGWTQLRKYLRICPVGAVLASACAAEQSNEIKPDAPAPIIQAVSFVEGCWFHQGAERATTATMEFLRRDKRPDLYEGEWRRMNWGHSKGSYKVTFAVDGSSAGWGLWNQTEDPGEPKSPPYAYAPLPKELTKFLSPATRRATFERSEKVFFVVEEDRGTLSLYFLWRHGRTDYIFTGVRVACS